MIIVNVGWLNKENSIKFLCDDSFREYINLINDNIGLSLSHTNYFDTNFLSIMSTVHSLSLKNCNVLNKHFDLLSNVKQLTITLTYFIDVQKDVYKYKLNNISKLKLKKLTIIDKIIIYYKFQSNYIIDVNNINPPQIKNFKRYYTNNSDICIDIKDKSNYIVKIIDGYPIL